MQASRYLSMLLPTHCDKIPIFVKKNPKMEYPTTLDLNFDVKNEVDKKFILP